MAIKQNQVITKEDFEQALVTHRLSVSEVSRQTGIPRHIVSHFRNYGDGLKPEQAAKLRDYFESMGVEFTEEGANHNSGNLKVEQYFQISKSITDEVMRNALNLMDENDIRLAVLLKTPLAHESGFFGDGELTEDSVAVLQETFALLAGNYLTFRMLRGWPAFNVQPTTEKPETVRDMVLQTFMHPLVQAGLIATQATANQEEEVVA